MARGVLTFTLGGLVGCAVLLPPSEGARAAMIAGPATLDQPATVLPYAAVAFRALRNATLTGFTFHNQGNADTVVLVTDPIPGLSVATPAGQPIQTISVNWSLEAGKTYYLVAEYDEPHASNAMYATYGVALPSNDDIAMTASSLFGYDLPEIVNNTWGYGPNSNWTSFTNITTVAALDDGTPIPEPATGALLLAGLIGLGAARRRAA